ncbi:hypothetical protein EYR38_002268 [Pleurotus pulmonarius]|nr:hypothetical protein EYR38_002268 [Pleurotus pulmonarius]
MSSPPNIPPQAGTIPSAQGPIPGGASPFPKLPAMDNTLGAMFIGASLAMLYTRLPPSPHIVPLTRNPQLIRHHMPADIYIHHLASHSARQSMDPVVHHLPVVRLIGSVYVMSADYRHADLPWAPMQYTVHQAMTTAAMYKFLISDFVNPLALASKGVGSGNVYLHFCRLNQLARPVGFYWHNFAPSQILFLAHLGVLRNIFEPPPKDVHIDFDRPIGVIFFWQFHLSLEGFNHQLLTSTGPGLILAYKLSASSRVVFDLFVTFAMTLALYRSRSGVKRTDHVITLLIMFTVNTNLLTTLFSVSELVTFLVMPQATLYGALGLLSPKLYLNTLLASLNSREYMQKELTGATTGSNAIYPARVTIEGSSLQSYIDEQNTNEEVSNSSLFDTDKEG